MQDIGTYYIEVQGDIDEGSFNAVSPLQMTVVRKRPTGTTFTICADQSGLIGMLRHIHRHGFLLLSVSIDTYRPSDTVEDAT